MLLQKIYILDYLRGSSIIIRDHSYCLSIQYKEGAIGELVVDKGIFYATGLPLRQRVRYIIKEDYLYFFSTDGK